VHGASAELYVDNAKIYHAKALKIACCALNIRLIHRGVGDPPPGGLIERFFGTAQTQLEAEVRAGAILTLDRLNQALSAWLHESYHARTHSETGQSPRVRYEQGRRFVREVNIQEVLGYFLHRERRTVNNIFSDVQLDRVFYRADPKLRGDRVEVRYDPFGPRESVRLYSLDGEYLGTAPRHEREQGQDAPTPGQQPQPQHNYIDLLIDKHQRTLRNKSGGIDYVAALAQADRRWPFVEFAKRLARLLGRPGGLAAFSTDELETLRKAHLRLAALDADLLEQACERARERTVIEIVFLLQKLADEKERKL